MISPHEGEARMDNAVAGRLARLATLPVDTSALDRALRTQIPPRAPAARRWWAPLTAAAALLILTMLLTFGLFQGRQAQASALLMAQMHQDIVSGKVPTMQADSNGRWYKAVQISGTSMTMPIPDVAPAARMSARTDPV